MAHNILEKKQTSSEQAAAVGSFLTDGLICFDFAHIGCDLFIGKHDDNDDIINKGDETPVEKTRTQLNTDRINIRNTEVGGSMRCMADFSGVKLYLDNTTVDALSVPNEKNSGQSIRAGALVTTVYIFSMLRMIAVVKISTT